MERKDITFGGNEVTVIGNQVKVGDQAPDFVAVNNDLSPYDSKEGKGKVRVFSVVPSIDTGVCELQTKRFNEEAAKLGDEVEILTISVDLPFAQGRFCAIEGIDQAKIVSDYKDLDFGEKYGFIIKEFRLLTRGIVVVNKENEITYVEYVPEVTNHPDYDKALAAVKELL
ncbi:MAG: thiol peroxidase [Tissierellia bacterium]|nr:thiol peroxidase [Tissierellia bacterium]